MLMRLLTEMKRFKAFSRFSTSMHEA